jgi:hypothetical protein
MTADYPLIDSALDRGKGVLGHDRGEVRGGIGPWVNIS